MATTSSKQQVATGEGYIPTFNLKAFLHLTVMRIESASTISYLKRISPKALSSRIKSKPHQEMVLCGPMQINTRAPRACDPAEKTMAHGAGWSNEAIRALVSLWGEANVQEELDGVSRNRTINEGIAEGMHKAGYDYTWKQCRMKVKN